MVSQVNAITGAGAIIAYGNETSFNNATLPTINKVFGRQQRATSIDVQSNFEYIYELYSRVASFGRFKQFEGSLTIESVMASPWILKNALGQVNVTGTGPYTHTYSRLGAGSTVAGLPSMAVQANFQPASGNIVRTFTGCVVKSIQIAGAVNDWVKLTTDMFFAQEQTPGTTLTAAGNGTNGTMTSTYADSMEPFIFSDGQLYIPGPASTGTPIAEVQNFTITMNNNLLPVYGFNSRFAVEVLAQAFQVEMKVTAVFKDTTMLNDFLSTNGNSVSGGGSVGSTPCAIKFTALDGTSIEVDGLTMGYVSDFGLTGVEPNNLILEDVTLECADGQAIAVNSIATDP